MASINCHNNTGGYVLLIAAVMLAAAVCAGAAMAADVSYAENGGICGDDLTWEYDETDCVLTISGSGKMSDYSLGTAPWSDDYGDVISAVVLPDELTYIGSFAFSGLAQLTSFTVPGKVTGIGTNAFFDCPIGTLYNYSDVKIEPGSFGLPDSDIEILSDKCGDGLLWKYSETDHTLTLIGSGAMYDFEEKGSPWYEHCEDIAVIEMPNTLTYIGSFAFSDLTSLKSVIVPSGVESIGEAAFRGCSALTSVPILGSVTELGDRVFSKCSSLESLILPVTVKTIGASAFYECSALTSMNIPSGVGTIDVQTFAYCEALESIEIPSSVESICRDAFQSCGSLTVLVIPSSVKAIDDFVFRECGSLVTVYNFSSVEVAPGSRGLSDDAEVISDKCGNDLLWKYTEADQTLTVFGYGAMYDFEEKGAPWYEYREAITDILMPSELTRIGGFAFSDLTSLEYVKMPSNVESIGEGAFSGCTSLASVEIPSTVESIGEGAFSGCTSLGSAKLSSSLNAISDRMFSGCTALTDAEIPFAVNTIGEEAFFGCTSLSSAALPNSVMSIGDRAFSGCTSLASVEIPQYTESIGEEAFFGCTSLASAAISSSVITVGPSAFEGCTALTSVSWPGTAQTEIADRMFCGCTSLVSVTLPENVTRIGIEAFSGCTSLGSVPMSEYVKTIDERAFSGCISLETVEIPGSVETIGDMAFSNCELLGSVTMPSSLKTIGEGTFLNCYKLEFVTVPAYVESIGQNAFSWSFDKITVINYSAIEIGPGSYGLSANADIYSEKCGDDLFWKLTGNGSTLTVKGHGEMYSYSPGSAPWYSSRTAITEVDLPDGIGNIGGYAFSELTSLASVTIPESVGTVGGWAFSGCTSLSSVSMSEGLETIGERAFFNCIRLVSVEIPGSVKTIGDSAFNQCSALTSVTLPGSIDTISGYMFYKCHSLTSVNIPGSVTGVMGYAFAYCSGLKEVFMPNSVAEIGDGAFEGCTELTWLVTYYPGAPDDGAFFGKSTVVSLNIPGSVTAIGAAAFRGCDALASVNIPASVKSIGDGAFTDCAQIGTIYNSSGLDVSGGAYGLPAGAEIVSNHCGTDLVWKYSEDEATLIIVGSGTMTSYTGSITNGVSTNAPWFSYRQNIKYIELPDGLQSIGDYAFAGLSSVSSVSIPETVTAIGEGAFFECFALGSVTIPGSVATLGQYSFARCQGLTSVIFPESGSLTLGDGIFVDCAKLESVVLTESVKKMGMTVFLGCTALKSVVILGPITSIPQTVFQDCTSLTTLEIPDSVVTIGIHAFYGCTALSSLYIPDSVTTIATEAFYGCTSLTAVNLPRFIIYDSQSSSGLWSDAFTGSSVMVLYNYSQISVTPGSFGLSSKAVVYSDKCGDHLVWNFDNDSLTLHIYGFGAMTDYSAADTPWHGFRENIAAIGLPDGLSHIGTCAFYGCSNLTSAVLPGSLETIGDRAFYGCFDLSSAVLPGSLETIGDQAFYNCCSLESLDIPDSVTAIGDGAFYGCSSLTTVSKLGSAVTIGEMAFCGCNMTSVIIPAATESIGRDAFANTPIAIVYNYSSLKIVPGEVGLSEDVTIKDLSGETVTVSFYDGEVLYREVEQTAGKNYVLPSAPERPGEFTFLGWFTSDGTEITTDDFVNPDVTALYAAWTLTVTFNDGGTETPIAEYVGGEYTFPEQPERPGFVFEGWFTEKGGKGTQVPAGTVVSAEDATVLYAKWTFNVTFTDGENETVVEETVDTEYILPEEPSKEGFAFSGWFTGTGGTGTQIGTETVAAFEDATAVFACWKFSVDFMFDEGPTAVEETVDAKYVLPLAPTKGGYEFAGWFTGTGGSGTPVDTETTVGFNDARTLYAKWTVIVSFYDGEEYTNITQTLDSTYTLPPEDTKEGYEFGGWFTQPDGGGRRITANDTVSVGDPTSLYALWIPAPVLSVLGGAPNGDASLNTATESYGPSPAVSAGDVSAEDSVSFGGSGLVFGIVAAVLAAIAVAAFALLRSGSAKGPGAL